ncbi:cyclic nucleotide-binding domain protein (macronuclear) [Tetrahymena thermophila SB210]|uniref:Cyclic nucleotide-binding domain protein n=1 Tax=Tetrahymena thermophila (strain SB210) TaxID=312017 RepID=I7M0N7_TETTS|nr:cyclic nucleotide-binding domain protein [Tetrahymena thermophila SB210]EAR89943.2 cyclic nucleotide-binding domain protein [Tetrahymena thermophila SB210]|eukprot:XP_001010188.2 cyclic nucleotide-binding domain protein [Tetrahymena thermophila SB210]
MDYEENKNSDQDEVQELRQLIELESKDKLNANQISQIVCYLKQFPQLICYINNEIYEQSFLRDIAVNLQYKRVAKGQIFIQQGEKFHNFYLILQGSLNLFVKKTQEQYNQELNWFKQHTNAQQLLNSNQADSLNQMQIQKLKEQVQKAEGFLKVLQTPLDDQILLLPYQEFYKHNQKICMYKQVNDQIKQFNCLGDIYDINQVSNYLMIAKQDIDIAYLPQDSYTKLFSSSIQQHNFIIRCLEKLLSNGINKSEISKMSKLFKERILTGSIFNEQEESKEIFIVKKGVVVIKKGDLKVAEINQGKIFGHENALSEQDRTISAETKDKNLCTLYCVNVFDLCEVVSLELLKTLMKQGRKKLEQYQEASFKFQHVAFESQRKSQLKRYKMENSENSFNQNHRLSKSQVHSSQNRSQSQQNHRETRQVSSQMSMRTQENSNNTSINQIQQRECLQTQQNINSNVKHIQGNPIAQSTQTIVSCIANPPPKVTHQLQTSGLIFTMGTSSQNYQMPPFQTSNSNYLSLLKLSAQENQLQDYLQEKIKQNKTDFQSNRFYSQVAKKVSTLNSNIYQEFKKSSSRKLLDNKEIQNYQSENNNNNNLKQFQTDQSWFVIKRINTPSRSRKAQTQQNSQVQSPSSNQIQTCQSKEYNSFSNTMTQITKSNNNTEEQEQPNKQRATLTSYIRQRNAQNGYFAAQSVENSKIQTSILEIKSKNERNNFIEILNNHAKDGISQVSNQNKQEINIIDQNANSQTNLIKNSTNFTAVNSLPSQEDEDERLDFNLECRYAVKKNLIQQSKYLSYQQSPNHNSYNSNNNNLINNIRPIANYESYLNIIPIDINDFTQLNNKNNNHSNNTKNTNPKLQNDKNQNNQITEKIQLSPNITIQKRPLTNVSKNKYKKDDIQNSQFVKYQIMTQNYQKKQSTKINIFSQTDVQTVEEFKQNSRKNSSQIFNNTLLSKKLEKSQASSRNSDIQKDNSSENKQNISPTSDHNNLEALCVRKISLGSYISSNGASLKKSSVQSPNLQKNDEIILENQFQDDQFSLNRNSDRIKCKDTNISDNKVNISLVQQQPQNIRIKLRNSSYQLNAKIQNTQN